MDIKFSNLKKSFPSLTHRNFKMFLSGQLISTLGSWMQNIAQPWLVLTLTNSPFLLGLVSAFQTLPVMLFSFLAGSFVDLYPKKMILILTQTGLAITALLLGLLTKYNLITYPQILVIALIFGVLNTIDMPARQSYVMELVGKEDLMNAIALNSSVFNLSRIIGPAIAGILINKVGIAICFIINAFSYLPLIIQLIRIDTPVRMPKRQSKPERILKNMMDGLQYVVHNERMRVLFSVFLVMSLFLMNFGLLNPVLAKMDLKSDASGLSFLMTSMGVGALIGALLVILLRWKNPTMKQIFWISFCFSITQILLSFSGRIALSAFIMSFIAFFMVLFSTLCNSSIQMESDDIHRGRVMSVYSFVFVGIAPIGSIYAGALSSWIGARGTYLVSGIIGIICTIIISWIFFKNQKSVSISNQLLTKESE
ncbi:MFS transporter [bacterium]|nr:MFS transporter [bacterium]